MKRDIAIYFLLPIVFFIACQSNQEIATNEVDTSDIPDQVSFDATLTTTHSGELASKIKYGRMEKYSNKKLIKFTDGVEIENYDGAMLKSEVIAEQAELNEANDNLELMGHVVVKTSDGVEVLARRLHWDEQKDIVTSEDFVTVITAENDTINGVGFESARSFKDWTIKQPSGVTQKKLSLTSDADSTDTK